MRIKAGIVHGAQALLEAGLVATLVVGLVAGTALAGKPAGGGGGKGGTTVTVAMVADANGNGAPNWGDTVTFRFTTSNPYPVMSVRCSQNGYVVYGDSHPMYTPNPWNDPGHFVLSSLAWSGGSASCLAELKGTSNGRIVVLGSTTFAAGA
jgi:hypothetical protein